MKIELANKQAAYMYAIRLAEPEKESRNYVFASELRISKLFRLDQLFTISHCCHKRRFPAELKKSFIRDWVGPNLKDQKFFSPKMRFQEKMTDRSGRSQKLHCKLDARELKTSGSFRSQSNKIIPKVGGVRRRKRQN